MRLVAILDAPAGQPHLDVGHVRLVVVVLVRHEQQVGRRSEEQATKADRDRGGEGNAFEEHLPAVGDTVVIGVLEDQDPAVAVVREAGDP